MSIASSILEIFERIFDFNLLAKFYNFLFLDSDFKVDKRRYADVEVR